MKVAYVGSTITGINRKAQEGELDTNITPQDLVWGMDNEKYFMVGLVFNAKSQAEVDAIEADRQTVKDKQTELDAVDMAFMEAEALPVLVTVDAVEYSFKAGYESSAMIDSARTLADNLNENDVELWDFYDEPHIFSKADANNIAIAVGLSFRTNYSTTKHAKKVINDA